MRWRTAIAVVLAAIALVANLADVLFLDWSGPLIAVPWVLGTFSGVGLIVALRRPRSPVGWLFLVAGASFALPFATAWIGQNDFAPIPVAVYGIIQLLAAIAYYGLIHSLIAVPGQAIALGVAVGRDVQGKISPALYVIAIPIALVAPAISMAIYGAVVLMWIVPDRRMERVIAR